MEKSLSQNIEANEQELAERRSAVTKLADGAEQNAGRYALALWARDNGLDEAARAEFEAVLAADPDHTGARAALGDRPGVKDRGLRYEDFVTHLGGIPRSTQP